jgi:S1-C subfamily serine protease
MKKQMGLCRISRYLCSAIMTMSFLGVALGTADGQAADKQQKEIIREGNRVVLSRQFADEVKKSSDIVLSKVAVRARLDKEGILSGYQLVQIDRGSVVELMGFRAGDIITKVNGVPARDFEGKRASLESATKFGVAVARKGKHLSLRFEIR